MQATSSTSPSSELRLRFSGSDPYDFVHWYPLLSCIKTIPAAIIPVQYATALALKRVSEDYQYRQQLLRFCGDDVSKLPPRSPLPQELGTLSSQIDEALVQNGWGSVFVRMSDRSPKDAVYQTESFWQILDTQLARAAQEKSSATEQTAADVVAFIRASCFAQRVTSGAQAVQLLARSKRIRDDVSRVCLMQGDGMGRVEGDAEVEAKAAEVSTLPPSPLSSGAAPFALSVIIRPWLESIAPEYEFRAFVYQRRVVAITQYYKLAYVPELACAKQRVQDVVCKFVHEEVIPLLDESMESLTLDLVIDEERFRAFATDCVTLIEINHPPPLAGTSLFDWDDPFDRLILAPSPPITPLPPPTTRILLSPPPPSVLHSSIYQLLLPRFLEAVRVRNNKKLQDSQKKCAVQ